MFEGVIGDSFFGDIALDDVTLYDGTCPQEGNGHQSINGIPVRIAYYRFSKCTNATATCRYSIYEKEVLHMHIYTLLYTHTKGRGGVLVFKHPLLSENSY